MTSGNFIRMFVNLTENNLLAYLHRNNWARFARPSAYLMLAHSLRHFYRFIMREEDAPRDMKIVWNNAIIRSGRARFKQTKKS